MQFVDKLAQEIRKVDSNHSLGAGALAEALMPLIEAALSAAPAAEPAKEIDGGEFETWSLSELAAQCRMQSREQLDPEFSRFMSEVGKRLSSPPYPKEGGPTATPQSIANEMRRLRKVRKLGTRELAAEIGIAAATLNRLENYQDVSVETARAILPYAGACLCCGSAWIGPDAALQREGGK